MKKIVLLGANGQLGTDIQAVFSNSSKHQVIPIYRKDVDVEKENQIADFLNKLGDFHYLINCMAFTNTEECENQPRKAFAINSAAALDMAQFCSEHRKVLFHISTDYVFDGKKDKPYTEADCPHALNVYGNSKLAGEYCIQSNHDQYFIFRVSSLFGRAGASGKGGNFVETMLRLAHEGIPLKVINDQIMSPTHTLDIARAIYTFIHLGIEQYGIYHCSGEGECSWYDFAQEIFRQLHIQPDLIPISYLSYKTKAKRPPYSVLDNSKIKQIYQMPHWRDSLIEYLSIKGYTIS